MAKQKRIAPTQPDVDAAEVKRQRKAAKRATKAAAEAEPEAVPEVDEVEAKRLRKAAKRAAKKAAAAAVEETAVGEPETPKKGKKKKRDVEATVAHDVEEVPLEKKAKKDIEEKAETNGDTAFKHRFGDDFKVFVRGLPWAVDEDALRKHFSECGEIEDLKMCKSAAGRSRGVAFIKFATREGSDAAIKLDNTDCGGRMMNVAQVEKREGKEGKAKGKGHGDGLTVFVRGLPFSSKEALLRKDFGECGEIDNLNFPLNPEGKPRGICFIKFKSVEGLEAALKFDNTDYGGRTINVCKAVPAHVVEKGKNKDGKGKGKGGKGKDGKSKGGKSNGKTKSDSSAVAFEGKKETFADSDDE